ncbi:MAG TPA: hypothetical protein VJU17_10025 [Gemmatimonadales bacterium]|nr:hypothetical protein [Gemmatimonadales bacterium]
MIISGPGQARSQAPAGLAAAALANTSFKWIERQTPGFRVYFLADSYPAAHQDSLLARLPKALAHARKLTQSPPLVGPIDLFFIESRPQMAALTGFPATGFAQPAARAVFLVTNPDWRAFERHEIMHVVAGQSWGAAGPDTDWLQEGLAQAADGACAGHSNADVALALARRHGWIPLGSVLSAFRQQPDLRAYLQAAAFTDHLLKHFGSESLKTLWRNGSQPGTVIGGRSLASAEEEWKEQLSAAHRLSRATLARVESKGCG